MSLVSIYESNFFKEVRAIQVFIILFRYSCREVRHTVPHFSQSLAFAGFTTAMLMASAAVVGCVTAVVVTATAMVLCRRRRRKAAAFAGGKKQQKDSHQLQHQVSSIIAPVSTCNSITYTPIFRSASAHRARCSRSHEKRDQRYVENLDTNNHEDSRKPLVWFYRVKCCGTSLIFQAI